MNGQPSTSNAKRRRRLYISRMVQGRILARMTLYFGVYHVVLWHAMFLYEFTRYRAALLDHGQLLTFSQLYTRFAAEQYPLLLCATAVFPFLFLDVLKLTNRIVGPLIRFQTVLSRMSRGEPVSEVRLRDGDLLVEFQDVFNDFLTNTDLARRAKEQRTLPPSSSPEPPRASVEETLLHDLRDLQMTTRRAVENKPAPPQRTN